MLHNILVLRDVPKQRAIIDLVDYPLRGGFRGFESVPAGFHAVAVQRGDTYTRPYWFFTKSQQVIVLRYSSESGQLEPDTADNTSQFTQLANSGAMGEALYPYVNMAWELWSGLTEYITAQDSIPTLNTDNQAEGQSRIIAAFEGTHRRNVNTFVVELQYAFIRWWVHSSLNQDDVEARERWIHLLNALYNAGEFTMRTYPALFVAVVPILIRQLTQLPDVSFTPNSAFTGHAHYLAEDLIDTENAALVIQGKKLSEYLASRR